MLSRTPVTYIGRFAPSPTGPLHLGSLYAALASYLDAKSHEGRWLLRIDDLDTPRNQPGAIDSILKILEIYGLEWDGSVYYQSAHLPYYADKLNTLSRQNHVYRCCCSRKQLALEASPVYSGYCLKHPPANHKKAALRVKSDDVVIQFDDLLQGRQQSHISSEQGDFIVQRKDAIYAYQFAVVVDDYLQQITHVVRGYDLLDNTPRQIYLQTLLGYPEIQYRHIPVIVDPQGQKLSKQTRAEPVCAKSPEKTLYLLLSLLKMNPPDSLTQASVAEIITWGISHWRIENLKQIHSLAEH